MKMARKQNKQKNEMLSIIKYPLATEKSIRIMESENKLIFVVSNKSNKPAIKKALESLYNVKVMKINTSRDMKGNKKAIVKFSDETPAIDLATKFGIV